jgi:tetratricopeptide (TPR) repeat protein
MTKSWINIIAVFLIPCLIADAVIPAYAALMSAPRLMSVMNSSTSFAEQALSPEPSSIPRKSSVVDATCRMVHWMWGVLPRYDPLSFGMNGGSMRKGKKHQSSRNISTAPAKSEQRPIVAIEQTSTSPQIQGMRASIRWAYCEALTRIIRRKDKKRPQALAGLAIRMSEAGRYDDALRIWDLLNLEMNRLSWGKEEPTDESFRHQLAIDLNGNLAGETLSYIAQSMAASGVEAKILKDEILGRVERSDYRHIPAAIGAFAERLAAQGEFTTALEVLDWRKNPGDSWGTDIDGNVPVCPAISRARVAIHLRRSGRFQEADALFQGALLRAKNNPENAREFARLYVRSNQWRKALALVDTDNFQDVKRSLIAHELAAIGQPMRAMAVLRQSRESSEVIAPVLAFIARRLYDSKQTIRANAIFAQAQAVANTIVAGDLKAAAYAMMSANFVFSGNHGKAKRLLLDADKLLSKYRLPWAKPRLTTMLYVAGQFQSIGDSENALRIFDEATAASSQDGYINLETLFSYAEIAGRLVESGFLSEAVSLFRTTNDINSITGQQLLAANFLLLLTASPLESLMIARTASKRDQERDDVLIKVVAERSKVPGRVDQPLQWLDQVSHGFRDHAKARALMLLMLSYPTERNIWDEDISRLRSEEIISQEQYDHLYATLALKRNEPASNSFRPTV